jgi:hypothetical protein
MVHMVIQRIEGIVTTTEFNLLSIERRHGFDSVLHNNYQIVIKIILGTVLPTLNERVKLISSHGRTSRHSGIQIFFITEF